LSLSAIVLGVKNPLDSDDSARSEQRRITLFNFTMERMTAGVRSVWIGFSQIRMANSERIVADTVAESCYTRKEMKREIC